MANRDPEKWETERSVPSGDALDLRPLIREVQIASVSIVVAILITLREPEGSLLSEDSFRKQVINEAFRIVDDIRKFY